MEKQELLTNGCWKKVINPTNVLLIQELISTYVHTTLYYMIA